MSEISTLDAAAQGRGVVPAFQPIVNLESAAVVGFEALARWPRIDTIGVGDVFQHADIVGSREQLNERCANAALAAALDADLPAKTLIAVNYEPDSPYPGRVDVELLRHARSRFTLAFELTERGMLTHPQTLLATVAAMRADGFLVVLDDVGAHPDSLALLDVIEPDIIKLDMTLVQRRPQKAQARTITAVLAHHERTQSPILAEGIENETHLKHALALGASLGQGFKYGRAEPIASTLPPSPDWAAPTRSTRRKAPAPYDLVEQSSGARRVGPKHILTALSEHIETQASCTADPPIILTALQQRRYFTPETGRRYAELARFCPLVAVFGEDLPTRPGDGIRGVPLDPDDPLCAEWTVVALGPHLAVALIARECFIRDSPEIRDCERQFEFILSFERRLVTEAAHSLLQRML